MGTIGIIGAMEQEIINIKYAMDGITSSRIAGVDFYAGTINLTRVILAKCGVGKVNAAVATQAMIGAYQVGCIINTGAAGALSRDANIYDIVISDMLVMHDFDTAMLINIPGLPETTYTADPRLVAIAQEAAAGLKNRGIGVHTGIIATGDRFIHKSADRTALHAAHHALCVEMEGAAVAQACAMNNTPFVIIRAISDNADEGAKITFETFIHNAVKNLCEVIVHMIASPRMISLF